MPFEKATEKNFISFANKLCNFPSKPLRRTFSLMRMLSCGGFFVETTTRKNSPCENANCDHRRDSCEKFISLLPRYGYIFESKKCHKLLFYKEYVDNKNDLVTKKDSDLLGFCIVHEDILSMNGKRLGYTYVPESVIANPFLNHSDSIDWQPRAYLFGSIKRAIRVLEHDFLVEGNYFSQQNKITNCCAHAAIKMALRGFQQDIRAEAINEILGIEHEDHKATDGLETCQIQKAIEQLTGAATTLMSARQGDSPIDFLKEVYHVIESKLPVIVLFDTESNGGHAVSLMGHSFCPHTWLSYAQNLYFSQMKSLPSTHWCDNFVVQDDNMGPYYFLPTRTDSAYPAVPICQLKNPIHAVVVHPKGMEYVKKALSAEPWASEQLNTFVIELEKGLSEKDLKNKVYYRHYFSDYFKTNSLIFRTFLCSKSQYLTSISPTPLKDYYSFFEQKMPDFVWLVEISIPELFWINRRKIGEIAIDPELFSQRPEDALLFIRVPEFLSVVLDSNEQVVVQIEETTPSYPLVSVKSPMRQNCSV